MSAKRDYDDVDEGEISDDEPSPKRPRRLTGAQSRHRHQHSAIDPTWGQKYVFSNKGDATTIPYGEESDFEHDAEAMAYLRSVRQEAHGISHLLVAPTKQIGPQLPPELQGQHHDDEHEVKSESDGHQSVYAIASDARAYYEDGAYIARDPETDDDHEAQDEQARREKELHNAFFASTLDRYIRLRRILHSKPPPGAAKRLSVTQLTYAASLDSSTTIKRWSTIIRTADPHPLQLVLMSKDSVLRVLHVLLGGKFFFGGYTLSERTSQWLWGLLARLPDPWELNHAELASVRDLGRRAVLLGRSLAEMAALKAELAHGMMGVPESSDASSNADDDEPARTDIMEVERLARHGMNSHDDPPRVADVKQKSNRGGDAGEEGEVKEDEDADGNELQKSNRGGDAGEEGEVKEDEDADGNELQKSNRGGDAGEEDEVKEDEDADGNESQKSNRDGDAGEEGEVKEDEDADGNKSVDMDLSSDTGEGVAGEHGSAPGDATALETAKMALLSRIAEDAPERADEKDREAAKLRLRMNMRATLNMVLTVAGDFYGQRDLLQFREPFVGI